MNEQAKIHNVSCELQVFIAVNLIIVDKSILNTIYSMIHIPYLRHGGGGDLGYLTHILSLTGQFTMDKNLLIDIQHAVRYAISVEKRLSELLLCL